jgi:nucleoid-associated protein YgaU
MVKDGDTLSDIAQREVVPDRDGEPGWERIADANTDHVSDPNIIHAGWIMSLPN